MRVAHCLLCSSDDHKVVQRFYLSGTDLSEITVGNQGNAGYPGYQTPQMKLDENVTVNEDGTLYEIYVIANDKGALSESYYPATVQENTSLSEAYIGDGGVYAGAISQELMKTDYAAAGKFLMFNITLLNTRQSWTDTTLTEVRHTMTRQIRHARYTAWRTTLLTMPMQHPRILNTTRKPS